MNRAGRLKGKKAVSYMNYKSEDEDEAGHERLKNIRINN